MSLPTFVRPQVRGDEYLITAVAPGQGTKPVVVRSILCQFGWATGWRDTSGCVRQSMVSTRDEAVAEVVRVATARLRAGAR